MFTIVTYLIRFAAAVSALYLFRALSGFTSVDTTSVMVSLLMIVVFIQSEKKVKNNDKS